ncbi:unnamed protein product [Rotaria socialis]
MGSFCSDILLCFREDSRSRVRHQIMTESVVHIVVGNKSWIVTQCLTALKVFINIQQRPFDLFKNAIDLNN